MPSGNPDTFLLLPGLNLHPERLAPWKDLLSGEGHAALYPGEAGWDFDPASAGAHPCTPAWLAGLEAVLPAPGHAHPRDGARPTALFGYSLGGLLGMLHVALNPGSCSRVILLSPALRLKPHLSLAIRMGGSLLPDSLGLPSLAPADYRRHSRTTVAAYRGAKTLEHRLAPFLQRWLAGETAALPPLFIAYAPGDELIGTRPLAQLQAVAPFKVRCHVLRHPPMRSRPAHLGLDPDTLGPLEWERLNDAVAEWLNATGNGRTSMPLLPSQDREMYGG